MPAFKLKLPGTRCPVWSRPPEATETVSGPDGRPAVENVALLLSAVHLRLTACEPTVTLMVTGSIASLKFNFNVSPGPTSAPSARAVPLAVVTETTRGTMIVVKDHCAPGTRWWPRSMIGFRLTGYLVRAAKGCVGV